MEQLNVVKIVVTIVGYVDRDVVTKHVVYRLAVNATTPALNAQKTTRNVDTN